MPRGPLAIARALLLTGLCGFWLGLLLAWREFPGEFDWRYMTVSNLFSPKHNPLGHGWGTAGVAWCGVMGLCWAALAAPRFRWRHAQQWLYECGVLAVGFLCMILAALLPSELFVHKSHEWLAVIAFVAVCGGMVRTWILALWRWRPPAAEHRVSGAIALSAAALWPVAGAAATQAYLAVVRPDLPWVTLAWRAQQVPLYLSFALWEWLTCLVLSACMLTVCLLPAQARSPASSSA